jgi:WS/DGAT/MGAT family acyltransferase
MQQFYQPRAGTVTEAARAWTPEPLPSRLQLWGHALRDLPMVLAKHLPSAALGVARKLRLERRYAKAGKPHPSAGMMKQTPINQILSPGRTFVCDNLSLADFQRVGKSLGYTVNDVFSACSAGAVRKLLKDMNYDPDQHPLIAGVPFAGKRPPGMEGIGNYVTVDFCWLRSDLADPRERLEASRVANLEMKEHLKTSAEAGADLASVIQALPPVVMRGVRRLIHRMDGKVGFFGNVGLSNVPGPKESLYLNKWKVSDWYSVGQVVDGTAINLTMWSYAGKACVCLMLDRAVVPDGWKLFNYFAEELAQLVALVPQQPEKNTV